MMTMRLQVILEHIPITQSQIQNYIVHTQVNKVECRAPGMTSFIFELSSCNFLPGDRLRLFV